MKTRELDAATAERLAAVALSNVRRPFPHRLDHLVTAPGEPPEHWRLHPAFFGSYDWHSAVHMHWSLARLQRALASPAIAACLEEHLTPANIAAELAYFRGPAGASFERPYGWAWLLELDAELIRLGRWHDAVAPLARELAARLARYLRATPYPVRAGAHGNTAFAAVLALDYAQVTPDHELAAAIGETARRWYLGDRNAPLDYEPSGDDFLSPALVEALLMQRVLPAAEFASWRRQFLPEGPAALAAPPTVLDHADGKQSHLDGLCLSRAWCFRRLGFEALAGPLLEAAMPHVTGSEYAGSHWLASFALLALGEWP